MDYEIVNLEAKTVAGISAVTNNFAPEMSAVIGGLWEKFYAGVYTSIPAKVNDKALEIYTDYVNDEKSDYRVMVACETKSAENSLQGLDVRTIPAGRYAKFVVRGHMVTAVADFWQQLWAIDLDRAYVCDFEEYQNGDMENAEIHIYIGLK